jgi:hypothetical protein
MSHIETIVVARGGEYMHAKWMQRWEMVAVVLVLAPLMAVAQPRSREARPDHSAERARGEIHVVNDLRNEVRLSMWSEQQERLGEWSIRPGENVVLQERGERIRVRSHDKMMMGDDGGGVEVGQVGQFQNGVWRVNVRDVWAAIYEDRPEGRDSRRGEDPPRETAPRREDSVVDQILKQIR